MNRYALQNKLCQIYEPAALTTARTKPLSLQAVTGIMLVLAAGFVFSCMILMSEISRRKMALSKPMRKTRNLSDLPIQATSGRVSTSSGGRGVLEQGVQSKLLPVWFGRTSSSRFLTPIVIHLQKEFSRINQGPHPEEDHTRNAPELFAEGQIEVEEIGVDGEAL